MSFKFNTSIVKKSHQGLKEKQPSAVKSKHLMGHVLIPPGFHLKMNKLYTTFPI